MKAYMELQDANWLKVSFEHKECKYDMSKHFEHKLDNVYLVNSHKHKFGRWDGVVRFYNSRKEIIYVGLIRQVMSYLVKRSYDIEIGDKLKSYLADEIDYDLSKYQSEAFGLRTYQRKAVAQCLKHKRRLIQSPTASGKSFIIYNTVSALRDAGIASLIIVPSITLVSQMEGDFLDYGMEQSDIHTISEGADKYTDAPIVISTWQSLQGLIKSEDTSYFHRFGCVIADEAHGATSEMMIKIVTACENAYYRFGFSGTYYKPNTDLMTLVGLFGTKYVAITTREMIDAGYVPDLNIGIIILKYLEEDRRFLQGSAYTEEMDFIETHRNRNETVAKIVLSREGNTLCLFRKHKHGQFLKELAESNNTEGKPIYYLTGQNKNSERQEVIRILESNTNCLVFASYGIFSTGVSIKNLHNVVFGSDMKSYNKVAQSIGRALRKLAGKDDVTVYDIFDDLSIRMRKDGRGKLANPYENYAYQHGFDRVGLYEREEFDCQIKSILLKETYLEGIKEGDDDLLPVPM
jgi:superfamily II DNA or RNA helicase